MSQDEFGLSKNLRRNPEASENSFGEINGTSLIHESSQSDDLLFATLVDDYNSQDARSPETVSPKCSDLQNASPSAAIPIFFRNPDPPPAQSWTSQGKKLYFDSSSWLASRLMFQSQSSMDVPASLSVISDRDPNTVERSNLLNITKLVIKELIEWSIRHDRSLESDHPPLQHFFIVLEHAMRHGLKPKKGLLGPKKELWDVLQSVEKYSIEAQDITASTRDLPTVSTPIGRARAWLRLALMQKKLADYFKILIEQRDGILKDFYEPMALMMSDEAIILAGLLVGLNVIDCNFCLKEEDLDTQQGVIDFSLYLRSSRSSDSTADDVEPSKLDSMLDQKNYVEELNRHLDATVTNLQSRVETLMTTNALMKEDLAISKNVILSLQEENNALKQKLQLNTPAASDAPILGNRTEVVENFQAKIVESSEEVGSNLNENSSLAGTESSTITVASSQLPCNLSVADLSKRLHDERCLRESLEEEIQTQMRKKAETELQMKHLEKECHGKGDLVESLSRQLEDIKLINFEMYRKLQECEEELHDKGRLIDRLQLKTTQIATLLQKIEASKAFELASPCSPGIPGRSNVVDDSKSKIPTQEKNSDT